MIMRKAQFTSPLIILTVLIITILLITTRTSVENSFIKGINQLSTIINNYILFEEQDLNYQLNLTSQALELLSTINNSNTIINILKDYNTTQMNFTNNEVVIRYSRKYNKGIFVKEFNNLILIQYPYSSLVEQEQRFNKGEFRNCVQNHDCEYCVNEYDSGTMNWELILCLNNPLRVKIEIEDSEYALTKDYSYKMYNNSFIMV